MATSKNQVRKAPSAAKQKAAFRKAYLDIDESPMRYLEVASYDLLVSSNHPRLRGELSRKLNAITKDYPMDVVSAEALSFAHKQFAGFIAFLELTRVRQSKTTKAATSI